MKKQWIKWALGVLPAAALLIGGWFAVCAARREPPIVYTAGGELRIHDGVRGRTVNQGYNSSVITAATQLSGNGRQLYYIAPAGIAGTLYCADTSKNAEGPGRALAQNVSAVKVSKDGKAVVYQNPALELFVLEDSKPRRVDTSVREVLAVSGRYVLYSKYSAAGATGQSLYLCRLKASAVPKLISNDFEILIKADDSLSSFYYQTKTPDLGSDPSCHNLYYCRSSKGGSERLLPNVAEIYEVGDNGVVLFSVASEAGLSLDTVLTDTYAGTDASMKPPEAGGDGYNAALAAYQQKQLRDAARSALTERLGRVVKLEVFACKPAEYGARKPAATYIGDVSVAEAGEEAVFFRVRDWSGVKLTIEDVLTPAARQAAMDDRTVLTFCGVTAKGESANLCKTVKGRVREDGLLVDWTGKTARFLSYKDAGSGVGTLYEVPFTGGRFRTAELQAENVASFSANGLCVDMESAGRTQLISGQGRAVVFDDSVVPDTSVRLLAHTDHCCAAFYPVEGAKNAYTLYSIRGGKANLVSDSAGGTLYLRGKKAFLYIEQVEGQTGQGRLVLCEPHSGKPMNILLDTGISDVLTGPDGKISLPSA